MKFGWICPRCSASLSPRVKKCDCASGKETAPRVGEALRMPLVTPRKEKVEEQLFVRFDKYGHSLLPNEFCIELRLQDENMGFTPERYGTKEGAMRDAKKHFKTGRGSTMVTIYGPNGYEYTIRPEDVPG